MRAEHTARRIATDQSGPVLVDHFVSSARKASSSAPSRRALRSALSDRKSLFPSAATRVFGGPPGRAAVMEQVYVLDAVTDEATNAPGSFLRCSRLGRRWRAIWVAKCTLGRVRLIWGGFNYRKVDGPDYAMGGIIV